MAFTRVRGPGITTTDNYKVGVITASKFVGPFDGGVIGSGGLDVSGIVTATNLDVNGDGHVSGALTVTGNVSIGGTLTYMDVTNIDSVGIITAQEGIHLGIGATVGIVNVVSGISSFSKLNVDGNSTLSTATFSDDVTIVKSSGPLLELTTNTGANDATLRLSEGATGTTNNGGGMFYSGADNKLHITCGTDSTTKRITIDRDTGKVGIGSEIPNSKLEVWNGSNIEVLRLKDTHYNKYLTIRGGGSPNRMVIDSYEGGGGGADIDLASNGITNIRSTSNWRLGIGTGTPLGVAHVNVGGGTTEPFVIERSGSGESIWSMKPYAGNLYFRGGPAVANYATDRFAILYGGHNDRGGDVAFFGTAAGITSCLWDASADTLIFNDDVKAAFGNGSDFTLQHNNAHAIVKNTTGRIYVLSDDVWFKNEADNKTSARFFEGNEVYLYNNDTVRLTTTSTGITVTGEVAATNDYPTIRPTLDLNFASTKRLDSRITYSRSGPASFVNEQGLVELVSDNTPRFDHDPVTGECKGFLLEESRINLLPYSTDVVGQSAWSRAGCLTENTTATKAPDGSYDAIAIRDDRSNGQHTLYEDVAIGDITAVYTSSCWAKAGSQSFAEIFVNGTGASGTVTIAYKFNLSTGAATYTGTGGFSSGTSATATEYPNGWWRFTVTGDVADSASGSGTFRWHVRPRNDSSGNYQGDDSIGIYVWGLQLELGTFLTSYIPGGSKGSSVTRGADLALIDGEEFTDFFNQTEGTINCAYWLGNDSVGLRVFQINDSNNSVIDIVAGSGSGSGGYGYVNTGGTAQANGGSSSANASRLNTLHVTTLAYKENDVAGINIKNGTLTNDTSATLDGAYNRVTFYQGANGADQLNGHLKRVQYYPKRLPDNQLKNLNNQ